MFVNFGEEEALFCMKAISKLRNIGVKSELYPDKVKMKKQMNYANKRDIPFVIIVGEQEVNDDKYTLKNMKTGEQFICNINELIRLISK